MLRRTVIFATLGFTAAAVADPVVFYGMDSGTQNQWASRASSQAARDAWTATITGESSAKSFNFESMGANSAYKASHTLSGLGTVTATNGSAFMRIDKSYNDASNGFSLDSNKLYFKSSTGGNNRAVQFDFTQALKTFGTFVTGLGTGAQSKLFATVFYSDNSTSDHTIEGSSQGGILFWGIQAESGKSILAITFRQDKAGDSFGFDDIGFAYDVPSPLAVTLGMVSLGTVVTRRRRTTL
ncbi:MAG: hypothetical protein H6815_11735 [Phycisphaeraceae bacterium]|nr:hypothetical protein [Phycisphaerales bacterium]MCB9861110.1 hypothetical protein [Phycisphaeraceae bacterium]